MQVSVVGASGFIGNNICRSLLENGYKARTLVHVHSNSLENLDVEKVQGDILDPDSLRTFLKGSDVVFHAAGKISIDGDRDGTMRLVNVQGTKNVVEGCLAAGVQRLVFISSIHALRQTPDAELDETRAFVGDEGLLHDVSKSDAEKEVLKGQAQGLDTVIITPTASIGPYDFKPSFLGQALLALYHRKIPVLVSGGFDWVDVRDVAKAAVAAIESGKQNERYLISGVWKTVRELALLVQEITGTKAPKFTSPPWLAKMSVPLARAYSAITNTPMLYTHETLEVLLRCSRNITCAKAKRDLSFHPRPLRETLTDTFSWFKESGAL